MWVQVPDNPMMGGYPSNTTDPSLITMAKQVLKEHKADRKKKKADEEAKKAKDKPRLFTFLETWALVFAGSIPLTILQLWLLNFAQMYWNNLFNVPIPHP